MTFTLAFFLGMPPILIGILLYIVFSKRSSPDQQYRPLNYSYNTNRKIPVQFIKESNLAGSKNNYKRQFGDKKFLK